MPEGDMVTRQDLARAIQNVSGGNQIVIGGGGGPGGGFVTDPNTGCVISSPMTPTGLEATGTYRSVFLKWNLPTYCGHAYTEVLSAPTNSIGDAQIIGITKGNVFVDLNPAATGFPEATVEILDTPGAQEWEVPPGVTSVSLAAIGGGGSGARGFPGAAGSGGSGAELSRRPNVPVTPGSKLNVVVGRGGLGPTGVFEANGNDGQPSYVEYANDPLYGNASLVLAAGGRGGAFGQQTQGGSSVDGFPFSSVGQAQDLQLATGALPSSFSGDDQWFVNPDGSSVRVFRKDGNAFVQVFQFVATNAVWSAVLSSDGTYLAVGLSSSVGSLRIWKRSGDTFTELVGAISDLPSTIHQGLSFSPDDLHLAARVADAQNNSHLVIYKRVGDTFERLTTVDQSADSSSTHTAFSKDGTYLAVRNNSPFNTKIFTRIGDTFIAIDTPLDFSGQGSINSVNHVIAFSNNGQYLALTFSYTASTISSNDAAWQVYKFNETQQRWFRVPKPVDWTNLTQSARTQVSVSWSFDDKYLIIGTTERVLLFERNGDNFTRIENSTLFPAQSNSSVFANQSPLLAVRRSNGTTMYRHQVQSVDYFSFPGGEGGRGSTGPGSGGGAAGYSGRGGNAGDTSVGGALVAGGAGVGGGGGAGRIGGGGGGVNPRGPGASGGAQTDFSGGFGGSGGANGEDGPAGKGGWYGGGGGGVANENFEGVTPGDGGDGAVAIAYFGLSGFAQTTSRTSCYWIRHVNLNGLVGPEHSIDGVCASTAVDVEFLLNTLSGAITESQLFSSLGARINLIDAPDSADGSMAWYAYQEATARASAIAAEASERAERISTEATLRAEALAFEATQRAEAIADEALARGEAIVNLSEIIQNESLERVLALDGVQARFESDVTKTQSSITSLSEALATETETRALSVNTLKADLETDLATAKSSITSLSEALATETETRALTVNTLKADLETDLATAKSSITSLSEALATETETRALSVNTLKADLETDLAQAQSSITNLSEALATETETLALSISILESEFETALANAQSSIGNLTQTLANETETRAIAVSELKSALEADLARAESSIVNLSETLASETEARALSFEALRAELTTDLTQAQSSIVRLADALVNETEARANETNILQAAINKTSAALAQESGVRANAVEGLSAQWTVKLDLAGHVSGFGLASEWPVNGNPFSEFLIRADRFAVVGPTFAQSNAPTTNLYDGMVWLNTAVPGAPNAIVYSMPGTYSYTVPSGVTSIGAVAVGGGGSGARGDGSNYGSGGSGAELSHRSGIPVNPGQVLTITVGAGGLGPTGTGIADGNDGGESRINYANGALVLLAAGGLGGIYATQTPGGSSVSGGLYTNHPGGSGGRGYWTASGGGAGGYSGPGGNGGDTLAGGQAALGTAGQGGGGGGGQGGGFGGGGVGVQGEGPSGAAGAPPQGGSGGTAGGSGPGGAGGTFGGGGGGVLSGTPGNGGSGAVALLIPSGVTVQNETRYYHQATSTWELNPPEGFAQFVVQATPTTIDGVEVPPGVYLNTAYIRNASITNAKIADAAIDNAKIINLDAAKINTGFLNADRIEAESIKAEKIDSRGLTIKNTAGDVLLSAQGQLNDLVYIGSGSNRKFLSLTSINAQIAAINYIGEFASAPVPNATRNISFMTRVQEAGLGVVTVTTSVNHGFVEGNLVDVVGPPAPWAGVFEIFAIPAPNQFRYLQEGDNASRGSGGSVTSGLQRRNSVYKNTTDNQSYVLTGQPLAWTRLQFSGGSGQFQAPTLNSGWTDALANTTVPLANRALNDVVTQFRTGANPWAETRFWNGSAWVAATAVVDGNLLVSGTVGADKISAGAIQAGSAIIAEGAIGNAQIGNIIQSANYVPGVAGWKIDKLGNPEFNNLVARGEIVSGSTINGATISGGTIITPLIVRETDAGAPFFTRYIPTRYVSEPAVRTTSISSSHLRTTIFTSPPLPIRPFNAAPSGLSNIDRFKNGGFNNPSAFDSRGVEVLYDATPPSSRGEREWSLIIDRLNGSGGLIQNLFFLDFESLPSNHQFYTNTVQGITISWSRTPTFPEPDSEGNVGFQTGWRTSLRIFGTWNLGGNYTESNWGGQFPRLRIGITTWRGNGTYVTGLNEYNGLGLSANNHRGAENGN